MNRRLCTALALAVAFLAGGLYFNQANDVNAQDKPEPKFRGQLYPNWKKLGLTDDQVQKIYKVQTEYQTKIDDLEAKIKALKKEEMTKAEEVLTAAQKARLKEIKSGETDPVKPPPPPTAKPEPKPDK